jgi:hypothetical protein
VISNHQEGKQFVQQLTMWMDQNKNVESKIKRGSPQDFMSDFESQEDLILCLESLAKDTARAFEFSSSNPIHKFAL